jgi:hypothetical protein
MERESKRKRECKLKDDCVHTHGRWGPTQLVVEWISEVKCVGFIGESVRPRVIDEPHTTYGASIDALTIALAHVPYCPSLSRSRGSDGRNGIVGDNGRAEA